MHTLLLHSSTMPNERLVLNHLVFLTCFLVVSGIISPELRLTMLANLSRWSTNGHFYQVTDDTRSWSNARSASLAIGGYLATITSVTENTFVRNVYPSVEVWLGATDYGYTVGDFHWVDGPV